MDEQGRNSLKYRFNSLYQPPSHILTQSKEAFEQRYKKALSLME